MFRLKANTPRWVIILMDLFLSFIALAFAYLIRFDLKADKALIEKEWAILSKSILLYFGVKLVVFYFFKIHKGLVRYTSTEDIRRIFIAVSTSSVLYFIFGIIRYNYFDGSYLFPTSVLIMEFLACFFLMVGSRFIVKLLYLESIKSTEDVEQILIYGAGISGLITKRTIEKDTRLNYKIIGFIDDNKKMDGTRLEGIGIFHSSKLESLIKEEGVTTVIIAIQKPNENNRKAIVEICLALNVKIQKVPSAKSWINGEFSTKQIAKINIEDLLGRKPIVLDEQKIAAELNNKTILVTGAAGSIGSGMVRQIANYHPKKVILLDQAESPMYDFQHELLSSGLDLNFEVVIGDIRSFERMDRLFECFKPDYVFHAAAYKHVPLMLSLIHI
jgi:FlaA1/EpsC-like NDP-sugar epimerase